jgi:hypothetical protein
MNRSIPLATAALLAVVALTGCTTPLTSGPSSSPTGSAGSTDSATPTPGATDDGGAVVDPDVLFTISVTATAPNGAVADLSQVVYKPVASTDMQSADEAGLDGECDGWRAEFPAAAFVVSLINVTDKSRAGTSWDRSVAIASMNGWPHFSGEVSTFQAYCASYQVNLGASRAVTPVTAGAEADTSGGWAKIEYGFGIATDPSEDAPGPDDTLLSNCHIELSQYAIDNSAIAAGWATQAQEYPQLGCSFGGNEV